MLSGGAAKVLKAEREGFEPPEARTSTVFKTAAIDHSATSPNVSLTPSNRGAKIRNIIFLTNGLAQVAPKVGLVAIVAQLADRLFADLPDALSAKVYRGTYLIQTHLRLSSETEGVHQHEALSLIETVHSNAYLIR